MQIQIDKSVLLQWEGDNLITDQLVSSRLYHNMNRTPPIQNSGDHIGETLKKLPLFLYTVEKIDELQNT